MNYAKDFTTDQQQLIGQLNIPIENREYTTDEIKYDLYTITTHIMEKSLKNNDLINEMNKYNTVMDILAKNEKKKHYILIFFKKDSII